MSRDYGPLEVKVWGDFACFTRPEMKVERVSYPMMTPSAARGMLEAIFWKPEFTWIVQEIHVLAPIQYISLMRNEIKTRQSERSARNWAGDNGVGGFSASENRTQRHTLALRDVSYLIRADAEVKPGITDNVAKYRDQFRRRVQRGAFFSAPYLGCREFSAYFEPPDGTEQPIPVDGDLGRMLLEIEYPEGNRGLPRFFEAQLRQGILRAPPPAPNRNGGLPDASAAVA